jgi:hypothetical protein
VQTELNNLKIDIHSKTKELQNSLEIVPRQIHDEVVKRTAEFRNKDVSRREFSIVVDITLTCLWAVERVPRPGCGKFRSMLGPRLHPGHHRSRGSADSQDDNILDRIQNDLARVISDLEVSVGINPEIIAKYRRLNDEVCYLPFASDVCSNEYMTDALFS